MDGTLSIEKPSAKKVWVISPCETQKIILSEDRFNPCEVRLGTEKLGKTEKTQITLNFMRNFMSLFSFPNFLMFDSISSDMG